MHHPQPPPDRPSTRALVTLAVTYAGAAGLHGVLAMVVRTWWNGVLAGILAAVAVAFSVAVRRRYREAARIAPPDLRLVVAPEEPVLPTVKRRDTHSTRA